ncbi:hypothetical protein CVS40_11553 [Lucilia cuprina]|nr:hypothetical protein CVS40_11553 [Lucilia cuprina]
MREEWKMLVYFAWCSKSRKGLAKGSKEPTCTSVAALTTNQPHHMMCHFLL